MPEPLAAPEFAAPALVRSGASMVGVGTALPATIVPNSVLAEQLGIDAEWILKRTGIEERRSAQPGERLYAFAAAAGAEALAEAEVAIEFSEASPFPQVTDIQKDVYWESDNPSERKSQGRLFFD